MNKIYLIIFLMILFSASSCKFCLQQTYGRYLVTKELSSSTKVDSIFTITIPYELWNGLPLIKLNINDSDSQFNFLVDTGAFSSGTTKLAKEVNGEKKKRIRKTLDTNGEEKQGDFYLFRKIQINDLIISKMNLKCYDELVEGTIDGILGVDFMRDKIFFFDHKNQLLTISNDKNYNFNLSKSQFTKTKIWKSWDNKYFVYADFFNKRNKFLIDTGYNSFVTLDSKSNSLENVSPKKSYLVKIKGAFSSKFFVKNYYEIMNFSFLHQQFALGRLESGNSNKLGFDLFRKMDVQLDFRKNQLYLYSDTDDIFLGEEVPIMPIEFSFSKSDLYVRAVESSIYGSVDLLPGDIIVSIDNELVPNNLDQAIWFIKHLENKEKYIFQIQREDKIFSSEIERKLLKN